MNRKIETFKTREELIKKIILHELPVSIEEFERALEGKKVEVSEFITIKYNQIIWSI